jgi:hypothetical protein
MSRADWAANTPNPSHAVTEEEVTGGIDRQKFGEYLSVQRRTAIPCVAAAITARNSVNDSDRVYCPNSGTVCRPSWESNSFSRLNASSFGSEG